MELIIKSKWNFFFMFVLILFFDQDSLAQKKNNQASENNKANINTVVKNKAPDAVIDSLNKWKHSREFAYMGYLDSLLRKRTDIKADTTSINLTTEKSDRQKKSSDYSGMNEFLNSFPLKIFFWLLAVIFIGFIFYKIFIKNEIFNKRKTTITENEHEEIPALQEYSKYDSLIDEAEFKNEFNLAVRYLFLKTLKNLADKEIISFSPDKTNNEYLKEMASNAYQHQFASLINHYEYVWYGKFLIDKSKYQQLKEAFINFNKKI
jgi:hypothetical protein